MRIGRRLEAILVAPLTILLLGTVVFPALILLGYSLFVWHFLQPVGDRTLGNYAQALTDPLYRTLVVNTLAIGIPTTVGSVVGGFALAYYVVFGTGRGRQLLFGLIVTALMASYLVRIFAWRTLLGESGIINSFLIGTGLIGQPLGFLLFSRAAAVLAEVALFMPLAGLAFYAAISGISPAYREAARDLGAGRPQTLLRITIPLSGAAILATTALIFFLSAGDYVTPLLVGGIDSATVGTVIATNMGPVGNYGLGAGLSFMVLLGFTIAYLLLRAGMRAGGFLPERTV
jgi:ABC-type spermidine/putrescine transport system permease subunit I